MAIVVPIISSFDSRGVQKAMRDFKLLKSSGDKMAMGLLSANKGVNALSKSLGKLTAVGGAITGVIGSSLVSAAYESQKVMKQTEAIVTATGGAANKSAVQVQKLADSLSLKTGLDDEAIQTSLNLLLTFKQVRNEAGKGNDVFDRAAMAMLDLGNVFGSSDAAAKMLGKALSDPVRGVTALARAGVNFSQQQRDQIKTLVASGKTLEAQKLILAEVESQVGGTAAAGATSFDRMRVAVDNVMESLGTLLLPLVEKFSNYVITNIVPVFERFSEIVGKNGVGAGINYLAGSAVKAIFNMGKLGKTILVVAGAVTALKVATVTYRTAMVAMTVVTTLTDGALKALIVRLGQTKIAMMAAGGVTALITIAGLAYAKYSTDKTKAEEATRSFTEALLLEGVAQSEAFTKLTKDNAQFKIMVGALGDVGLTMNDVNQYITSGTGKFAKYVNALDVVAKSGKTGVQALDAFASAVGIAAGTQSSAGGELAFGLSEFANLAKQLRGDQLSTNAAVALLGKIGVNAFNSAGGAAQTAKQKFDKAKTAVKSVADTQKQLTDATKATVTAQAGLQTATDKLAVAQYKLNMIAKGYGVGSQEAVDAQKALTTAQNDSTRAGYALQKARFAVTDAEKELVKARMRGNPRDITEAEIALGEANLALSDSEADVEEKTKAVTTAQTALNETINGATTTSVTYVNALKEVTDAQAEQTTAIDNVRAAKEKELGVTQNLVKAEILLRKAKGGLTKKQKAALDRLLVDLNTPVAVNIPSATAGIVPMATGGIVTQPTLALVGEAGAEAVIPLTGSNARSMGNSTTIHVTVTSADPNAVVDALRRYQRQNGSIPVRTAA
jgi:hypothetical protein